MLAALSGVTTDSNINQNTVQIVAPVFPNGDDKNYTYPYYQYSAKGAKYSGGKQSNTSALVWQGSGWISGQPNQYPLKSVNTSSFDCLDQILQYFDNKSLYPNLNQIVVAGHSAGGQTINRYAAVGKSLALKTPVTYWIGNPNSLLWLDSSRPFDTSTCPSYDDWRSGLSNYVSSGMQYNTLLVTQGNAAVATNFLAKNKAYARGTQDLGDDSSDCAPYSQGSNRNERFFEFINKWPATCPSPNSTTGHCDTIDLINAGHDDGAMFGSAAGLARLFIDNFYGTGLRAFDFGYPREIKGDDPYPDPSFENIVSNDTTTYGNNMTSSGCWLDSGTRSLLNLAYDNTSNTVDLCILTCTELGYTIAGVEYGSQCWCDDYISEGATPVLSTGCAQTCAGDASQICGGDMRLSVYSNGAPDTRPAPGNPSAVYNDSYIYLDCYSEATTGRALSATSFSDSSNMTIDSCAAFCYGYQYFGIEYASECYCGSYLNAGSEIIDDLSCSMSCTGASLELCGGSFALSIYQLSSNFTGSLITQSSSTSTAANTASKSGQAIVPTASLCPNADGLTITDSNDVAYSISCNADSTSNSYGATYAMTSYLECMTFCDTDTSGCTAFTYVGSSYGNGAGTCWMKNSFGTTFSQNENYISAVRVSSNNSTDIVSVTSSTTFLASASPTTSIPVTSGTTSTSASLCPSVDGQTITDSNNTSYTVYCSSDSSQNSYGVGYATGSYLECMLLCDNDNPSCRGFTYVGAAYGNGAGTCWLKSSLGSFVSRDSTYITVARVDVGLSGSSVSLSNSSSTSSAKIATSTSSVSAAATSPVSTYCPATDRTTITSSDGVGYDIYCSSDSSIPSFGLAQVSGSYLDCMAACDIDSACNAFTYVGTNFGSGPGACWLKTGLGTTFAQGSNYISAVKHGVGISSSASTSSSLAASSSSKSSTNPSSPVASTSSISSASTAGTTTVSCPSSNNTVHKTGTGPSFMIECGVDHAAGDMGSVTVAALDIMACISVCATTTGCVDVSLSGTACYMKSSVGAAVAIGGVIGGRLVSSSSSFSATSATSTSGSANSSLATASSISSVSSAVLSSSSISTTSGGALATTFSTATRSVSTSSTLISSISTASLSLTSGFSSVGCFVDGSRPLPIANGSSSANTPQVCASNCRALDYKYSGTEYGQECWCGEYLPDTPAPSSDCSMACTGDKTQNCGAGNRLSVVVDSNWQQTFFARSSYSSWNLMSCYIDSTGTRLLPKSVSTPGGAKNMTIANCLDSCRSGGFIFCGAEYYGECYGSNTAPANTSIASGSEPLAMGCDLPCYGNSTESCGGSGKIIVYTNNGTTNGSSF